MKHIVDHPRTRVTSEKLERYRKLDLETADTVSAEVSAMVRQPRARRQGEKLRRFAELARRGA